jgi:hypothetical protein
MRSRVSRILFVVFLLAVGLMLSPRAEACMGCECYIQTPDYTYCGPCDGLPEFDEAIRVSFPEADRAVLYIPGFRASHFTPGHACFTALSPVDGIVGVSEVINFEAASDLPFSEVSFFADDFPAPAVTEMTQGMDTPVKGSGLWHTFVSDITGSVADGVANYFMVEVGLAEGVTPAQFVENLRNEGVFLTGSSDAQGVPDPVHGHVFVTRFGDFPMVVNYPGGVLDPPAGAHERDRFSHH